MQRDCRSTRVAAAHGPSKPDCIDQQHYGGADKKGQSEWRKNEDEPPRHLPGIVAIKTVHLHSGPTDEPENKQETQDPECIRQTVGPGTDIPEEPHNYRAGHPRRDRAQTHQAIVNAVSMS